MENQQKTGFISAVAFLSMSSKYDLSPHVII